MPMEVQTAELNVVALEHMHDNEIVNSEPGPANWKEVDMLPVQALERCDKVCALLLIQSVPMTRSAQF